MSFQVHLLALLLLPSPLKKSSLTGTENTITQTSQFVGQCILACAAYRP